MVNKAFVLLGPPAPPQDITIQAGSTPATIQVSWKPPTLTSTGTSNGANVTGYGVYAKGQRVSFLLLVRVISSCRCADRLPGKSSSSRFAELFWVSLQLFCHFIICLVCKLAVEFLNVNSSGRHSCSDMPSGSVTADWCESIQTCGADYCSQWATLCKSIGSLSRWLWEEMSFHTFKLLVYVFRWQR